MPDLIHDIKTITFRPLRRNKKTGKIIVASYMGWRNVRTKDYQKFNLIVNSEYKMMPKDEFVYNHKGELLFWFKDYNPADIPIFTHNPLMDLDEIFEEHNRKKGGYAIDWDSDFEGAWLNYNGNGMDCEGVPTFSHYTQDYVAREDIANYYGLDKFEPLTVGVVVKWFGWFLYQFRNSYLKIGK